MCNHIREIRIYPLDRSMYPSLEYAKMCIGNGLDGYTNISNLCSLNGGYLDLFWKTLFLFQYGGVIIAKAVVHIESYFWGYGYYLDEIEVLEEGITANDIKNVYTEYKKFNSSAQKISGEYLSEILKLFYEKKKADNIKLGDLESFCCNHAEGNRIEYYVTKYERNPKYREQAIKIHGLSCKTCGFNFEMSYGRLGERYIEVHHKKPLYTLKEEVILNPETDMICVCSNCHRMLHRHRNAIVTPEELIIYIKHQKEKITAKFENKNL